MEAGKQYKKGLWTEEEDRVLVEYISANGRGHWNSIPKVTGLKRCGKSCRLRWLNYLSPNVKHGDFSIEEEDLIIRLHNLLGNRWALIAGRVPGRTDNQVKNHWNTHLRKKLGMKKENRKEMVNVSSIKKQTHCSTGVEEERSKVFSQIDMKMEVKGEKNSCVMMNADESKWPSNSRNYWIESLISNEHLSVNSTDLAELLGEYAV